MFENLFSPATPPHTHPAVLLFLPCSSSPAHFSTHLHALQDAFTQLHASQFPGGVDRADPNLARMLELHEIARARTQMNEDAGGLSIEAATKLACEAMSMSGVRTESSGSVGSRSGVSSEGATSDVEGGGGETKGDTAGMESSTSGGGVDEVGGPVDEEDDEEAEGDSVCPTVTQAVFV